MPRIVGRVVPEELELVPNERPDFRGNLLQILGEIAQILEGFQ
jgi:hypothetical protein